MSIGAASPWNAAVAARLSRAAQTLMSRAELAAHAAVAPKRLAAILDHAAVPSLDEFYTICAALELSPDATLGGRSPTDNSLSSLRLKVADIALTVSATTTSLIEIERKAAARHAELFTLLSGVMAIFGQRTKPERGHGANLDIGHGPKIGILDAEKFRAFRLQANCAEPSS